MSALPPIADDTPLLCSYIAANMLERRMAKTLTTDAPDVKGWEAAVKMQTQLATKLRITRHSRTDPKTLARQIQNRRASAYDQIA